MKAAPGLRGGCEAGASQVLLARRWYTHRGAGCSSRSAREAAERWHLVAGCPPQSPALAGGAALAWKQPAQHILEAGCVKEQYVCPTSKLSVCN